MVRRTSTSSEAGIAFANNGKNFWALSITGSQVFLTNWTGTSRIKYLVRSGKSYPTNSWKEVKVILSQSNRATVLINGANFGTYNLQGNIRGSVGLFSISGTAQFNETLIATSSTLRISLVECLTAQQFASKIAGILGISVTQVQNIGVTSNCQKRQVAAAEGNIYTFTLVGSESASSEALASQLTTQLSINHPSIVGNGITALSAFTPVVLPLEAALVTTLPVFGATAAGLSVGAIVGIALGAAAFVALVAAVVYGAFRFHNARKEKSTNQVEMAPTAATRNYIPKNGVDLMGPKRTSITGRSPPQNIN